MHIRYSLAPLAMSALFAAPAFSASLGVNIEVPRLNVSEYHRPYIATWIERADNTVAGTLAVWYDVRTKTNNPEGEGTKWLKDMRQWWRKAGREMSFPADGVSGATRAPGPQKLVFAGSKGALKDLKPGAYNLVVEAAREVGGHEAVRVPFTWGKPGKPATVKGSSELGAVTVSVK